MFIFQGPENKLELIRTYKLVSQCDFEMQMFPFDTQTCPIEIRVDRRIRDFVQLKIMETKNLGPKTMLQYDIKELKFGEYDNGNVWFFSNFHQIYSYS